MHRPFFSLTILLEIIAASLFLISSAYSQTGVAALDAAAGAAHGCGYLWRGESGREVRRNCVEVYRVLQTRCLVWRPIETAIGHQSLPWTIADNFVIASSALVTTGYDVDYDFAMFDGRYNDLAQSTIDIEGSVAAVAIDSETATYTPISCPAVAPYFDDYNCCLESGFNRSLYSETQSNYVGRESGCAWGVCDADGLVEATDSNEVISDCDAELACEYLRDAFAQSIGFAVTVWHSYTAPFVQPEEEVLSDADAQLALQKIHVAAQRAIEIIHIAVDSSWKPFAHHSLVIGAKNFSLADLAWEKPTFPVASTITLSEGQQIVVLTQAAATLDEIGLYMQEAAQQLRYIVADRIVSKGANRRIARERSR